MIPYLLRTYSALDAYIMYSITLTWESSHFAAVKTETLEKLPCSQWRVRLVIQR